MNCDGYLSMLATLPVAVLKPAALLTVTSGSIP